MPTPMRRTRAPEDADVVPATRFALEVGEDVSEGQLAVAVFHALRLSRADLHVHEMRKAAKRTRGVLRMVRANLSRDSYRSMNGGVRDVAREVSRMRSLTAMREVFGVLAADDPSLRSLTDTLRVALDIEASQARASITEGFEHDVRERLEAVRVRLEGSPPWDEIGRAGVQRTYMRGRDGFAMAYSYGTSDRFHAWRKEVKYLRHQLEVLAEVSRSDVGATVTRLAALGEMLGEYNDMADLARWARGTPERQASSEGVDALVRSMSQAAGNLATDMYELADPLFELDPDRFAASVFPLRGQGLGARSPR